MRDRLTKKRIHVDYLKVIRLLGLYSEFVDYVFYHGAYISARRLAYNFLRTKKVDIHACYLYLQEKPYADYSMLLVDHLSDKEFYL